MALFVGFMFVSCNDEDYGILEHKKNGIVDLLPILIWEKSIMIF